MVYWKLIKDVKEQRDERQGIFEKKSWKLRKHPEVFQNNSF